MSIAPYIPKLISSNKAAQRLVLQLPAPLEPVRFRELVHNNQIAVSHDGQSAAAVVSAFRGDGFQIVHSRLGVPSQRVVSDARILKVTPHRVIAWGVLQSGFSGTFVLTEDGTTPRQRLSRLRTLHPAGRFGLMPRGRCPEDPDDVERLVLLDSTFFVSKDSDWAVLHDGSILMVEPLDGPRFRYRLCRTLRGENEELRIVDFSPPLPFEAKTARALKLGGSYMYVVERAFGETVLWVNGHEVPIDGIVEQTWNSPATSSAVLLMRSRRLDRPHGAHRRLVRIRWPNPGSDDFIKTVYSGRFEMEKNDLWWSVCGRHFVTQITRVEEGLYGDVDTPLIVTSGGDIIDVPDGAKFRNPVLSREGRLVGYLLEHETSSVPVVEGVALESVLYAWNMGINTEGNLRLNLFDGDGIYDKEVLLNHS